MIQSIEYYPSGALKCVRYFDAPAPEPPRAVDELAKRRQREQWCQAGSVVPSSFIRAAAEQSRRDNAHTMLGIVARELGSHDTTTQNGEVW